MRLSLACVMFGLVTSAAADPVLPIGKPTPAPILVPYRLTKTQHVLVRAKINGKGPYNFIVDTGAPALFVAKKTADAAGVTADKRGWATFDRFEIEGGVVFETVKGKVDDLFQLEGMNGLGLAGVELHGVIGYNLLARYRIEYDFTRPKLAWTKLNFEPPAVGGIGGRSAPAGLEMIGGMMKVLGTMIGMQANFAVQPRGFLGVELAEADGAVVVRTVLAGSPAANAGLRPGDTLKRIGDDNVGSAKAASEKMSRLPERDKVTLTIGRAGGELTLNVELGRGL
jgi:hypothetical protein